MAASLWHPDIVVGIDFGMTCTGVAYSIGPDWPEPKTIQRWPGKLGHELRNKVDTAVSYDIKTGALNTWGFLCNPEDERFEFNELFKLYLNPNHEDPLGIAPTVNEAQGWFRDYMRCLYKYIDRHFRDTLPRYDTKRVDYVFSVPTTWKDPALLEAIEKQIKAAGFGQKAKERASIFLTEAEAAAAYSTKKMARDDIFVVCDAGGGTTDVNVLKVASDPQQTLELTPLSWTEGNAVGSTLIDFKARRVLSDRLRPIQNRIDGDLDTVVTRLIDDQFKTFKCSFGVEGMNIPRLFLPIPGLQPGQNFPDAGIENSKLIMTLFELKAIFDEQLEKMFGLIDQQLQIVQNSHPREIVSYLVLSGGLGTSPYIQNQARRRYENGGDLGFKNALSIKVLQATEPQLAVCHGLVIARTQKLRGGTNIYSKRCSPISYGIMCKERYNPDKHVREDMLHDEFDRRIQWAANQISWLVRQGETVDAETGVSKKFSHRFQYNHSPDAQQMTVYMSTLPALQLPSSIRAGGVKRVCHVRFDVSPGHMELKNRHWYSAGPKYYRAEYDVRVVMGTGLRFQVWGKDGLLSKDHEEIQVTWQPVEGRNTTQ